jgi:hypothetical protein
MLVFHHETKNAPTQAASEAVKRLTLGTDMEGWRFFLMKWAKRSEIRAGAFERKVGANQLDDVVGCSDLFDCL